LCQLALLPPESGLLEAIGLTHVVQFAVRGRTRADVVGVASFISVVVQINLHRVLFRSAEELAGHVVALVRRQGSVVADESRGVVVAGAGTRFKGSIDRAACVAFFTRYGA